MSFDLHARVPASAPEQSEMPWGRGKWCSQGIWRAGFSWQGCPEEGLASGCLRDAGEHSGASSGRFWWLTQPWAPSAVPLCWLSPESEGRDASLSHHHQMFSFEFPKRCALCVCVCVCPFLPWEIWYQASAGMAHLFREGFFLKWPCSVKNSLWRGSWVEIFVLHGGNVCVCESIIGLDYSQLKV